MIMKRILQSAILTMALILGTSAAMTVTHSLVAPTVAEAGVLGKIGGAVKGAAKTVGRGAKNAAVGVGSGVKKAAVAVGKVAVKLPPVDGVRKAVRAVRSKI
jgi:hypothetical protein